MSWKDWLNKWKPKPKPPVIRPPHTTTTTTTTTRGPLPPLPPPPSSTTPTDLDMDLFLAHNQTRILNGKPPYRWSDQLYQAAKSHSNHMADVNKMAHDSIGDGDPWQRIRATGYRFQTGSENVANGYRSVEQVMAGWMNSQGHRANILGSTTEMGGSMIISARGSYYWTTVFATPATALIAGMSPEEIRDIDSVTVESTEDGCEMSSIHIVTEEEERF